MPDKQKQTVSYYGKKVYYVNALVVRKKPVKEKLPDYGNEEYKGHHATNSQIETPIPPQQP